VISSIYSSGSQLVGSTLLQSLPGASEYDVDMKLNLKIKILRMKN
jgi:hypothetical protein